MLDLPRAHRCVPRVQSYFTQFGPISDVVVMTEGSSRRPRGFGFVTFENPSSVAAITRSRYHPIEGRLVEVKAAIPRELMHQGGGPPEAATAQAATASGMMPNALADGNVPQTGAYFDSSNHGNLYGNGYGNGYGCAAFLS